MNLTPYQTRLQVISREASDALDFATVELIANMHEHVQRSQYAALHGLFSLLRPLYRDRLGQPPAGRDQDLGSGCSRRSG